MRQVPGPRSTTLVGTGHWDLRTDSRIDGVGWLAQEPEPSYPCREFSLSSQASLNRQERVWKADGRTPFPSFRLTERGCMNSMVLEKPYSPCLVGLLNCICLMSLVMVCSRPTKLRFPNIDHTRALERTPLVECLLQK